LILAIDRDRLDVARELIRRGAAEPADIPELEMVRETGLRLMKEVRRKR
jgi:hypothetical protein